MIKLTRLNNHVVVINPDHIGWIETTPDTTLFLIGGEKIIVRESLDVLVALVIDFRRTVRAVEAGGQTLGSFEGDPPRIGSVPVARRMSEAPGSIRVRGGGE